MSAGRVGNLGSYYDSELQPGSDLDVHREFHLEGDAVDDRDACLAFEPQSDVVKDLDAYSEPVRMCVTTACL